MYMSNAEVAGRAHFCRIALLIIALTLSGCASTPPLPKPPAQPHYNDYLVVPGKRVGSVSIGMTSKQLLDAMGSPISTYHYTDGANYTYSGNFNVVVDADTQQVWRVSVGNGSYRTENGLAPGQTDLEMHAILGNPSSTTNVGNDDYPEYLNCYKQGLAVYINARGTIESLSVFNPGGVCK